MAGIGFELKKLFSKKGLFSILRAYGYAGIVCTGPMILGIVLLLGVRVLGAYGGADADQLELLICMLTYTLLFSLILTNICSMVTTRYIADELYMEHTAYIMPSFYGCTGIMLVIGCVGYAVFLHFAGIPLLYQALSLLIFGELIVVWTEMNYLTAVKDYQGILKTFFVALLIALAAGYVMMRFSLPVIPSMLLTVSCAYGIMMVWYYFLLIRYFPQGKGSCMRFLVTFDRYPALAGIGISVTCGLFIPMIIMWFSPIGEQIQGMFIAAPQYDVPSLFAFLSILVTTINFVTSVEVNFYPKYRNYFSLFNDGGSLMDIRQAEVEMKVTLEKELGYTFMKQFFSTVLFVVAGTMLIPSLPLGFTDDMLGIYRVLCVGYAFYAIGNSTMLILLYFSDEKGALICSSVFCFVSIAATFIFCNRSEVFYGFGFVLGGIAFTICALIRLYLYLHKLTYHVLSSQPIVVEYHRGIPTKISEYFNKKYKTGDNGRN